LFTTEKEEQRGYASLEEAVSESGNDSLNEKDKHHQSIGFDEDSVMMSLEQDIEAVSNGEDIALQ